MHRESVLRCLHMHETTNSRHANCKLPPTSNHRLPPIGVIAACTALIVVVLQPQLLRAHLWQLTLQLLPNIWLVTLLRAGSRMQLLRATPVTCPPLVNGLRGSGRGSECVNRQSALHAVLESHQDNSVMMIKEVTGMCPSSLNPLHMWRSGGTHSVSRGHVLTWLPQQFPVQA